MCEINIELKCTNTRFMFRTMHTYKDNKNLGRAQVNTPKTSYNLSTLVMKVEMDKKRDKKRVCMRRWPELGWFKLWSHTYLSYHD